MYTQRSVYPHCILSLQYDRPDLVKAYPKAARDVKLNQSFSSQCIAGAWQKWQTSFAASGVNVCPNWTLVSSVNPPQTGTTSVVQAGLPAYTTDKKTKPTDGEKPLRVYGAFRTIILSSRTCL